MLAVRACWIAIPTKVKTFLPYMEKERDLQLLQYYLKEDNKCLQYSTVSWIGCSNAIGKIISTRIVQSSGQLPNGEPFCAWLEKVHSKSTTQNVVNNILLLCSL